MHDGTCWLEDYITPKQRTEDPYTLIGRYRRIQLDKEEEAVKLLLSLDWKLIPPKD